VGVIYRGRQHINACLVDRGKLDLDTKVRRYLPDFRTHDREVARQVTVRQLLNHSAGWLGDDFQNTGQGDDALARYVTGMVARYVTGMVRLPQLTPTGALFSYSNSALSLGDRGSLRGRNCTRSSCTSRSCNEGADSQRPPDARRARRTCTGLRRAVPVDRAPLRMDLHPQETQRPTPPDRPARATSRARRLTIKTSGWLH